MYLCYIIFWFLYKNILSGILSYNLLNICMKCLYLCFLKYCIDFFWLVDNKVSSYGVKDFFKSRNYYYLE